MKVRAAVLAGTLSGAPSTVYNLATGRPVLEAARAAGNVVLPPDAATGPLLAAGAMSHAVLTLAWTAALTPLCARARRPVLAGAAAGLAIAAVDLGLVARGPLGRHMALIRALPVLPQVADHVAFGALVGACAGEAGIPGTIPSTPRPRPHFAVWHRKR